jgi:hypothetical protein
MNITWISIEDSLPDTCSDVLFSNGEVVRAGFLETHEPEEELIFYDPSNRDYFDDIIYWAHFPDAPQEDDHD